MLYLRTAEVQQAADAIIDRVKMAWPQARIHGLLVQSMANRAGAQELRVVVEHDPVFGPLIMLGEGGVEWRGSGRRRAPAAEYEPGALSGYPGDQK
jgi:acetyltransferase